MFSKAFFSIFCLLVIALFFTTCVAPEKKVDNTTILSKNIIHSPPSLAPGSANAKATILKYTRTTSSLSFTARIDTIYRYGASTPPLAIGSEINLNLVKTIPEANRNALIGQLRTGTSHKLQIYFIGKKPGNTSTAQWQIKKIIN